MPETSYSLVAELAGGMPNGEIPCGSIRMVSQWDGIPRQLLCFNMGPWAREKFRGSVTYASGIPYPPMPEGRESSQWR
jgi:hypothetical protein